MIEDATALETAFVVPAVTEGQVLSFRLTVTDESGASASAEVSVTISPLVTVTRKSTDNQPPTVGIAGYQQSRAASGQQVYLSGEASDAETASADLTFQWVQVGAPTVQLKWADARTAAFFAPEVSAEQTLRFRFTATDEGGASASAEAEITVFKPDTTPDPFSFEPGASVYTDPITITGIEAPVPLTLSAPAGTSVIL